LIGGIVNLAISYVFVFGAFGAPELGITGAAMGTAASAVTNCVLAFILIQRPKRELRVGRPRFDMLRPVLKVAIPAFGERGIFHAGFLVFAGMVGHLGNKAMAAHQACMAIESLGFIAAYALGSASGTIVAQKLGAEDPRAAKKAAVFTARFSFCLMSVIGLIFYVFAESLVSWFCTDPETIELGAMCMRIAAIAQPIMALVDAFAGTLRGAGDTRSPMVAALVGPVCMRLVACWYFGFELEMGLIGIWLGSTLDWLVRLIWLALIFSRGKWLEIKL
jgi:putative MATE family efflux protein